MQRAVAAVEVDRDAALGDGEVVEAVPELAGGGVDRPVGLELGMVASQQLPLGISAPLPDSRGADYRRPRRRPSLTLPPTGAWLYVGASSRSDLGPIKAGAPPTQRPTRIRGPLRRVYEQVAPWCWAEGSRHDPVAGQRVDSTGLLLYTLVRTVGREPKSFGVRSAKATRSDVAEEVITGQAFMSNATFSHLRGVAVLLVLAVASACGGSGGGGGSATKSCNNNSPFVIGVDWAISGPSAPIAAEYKPGAEMAIQDINKAGGIVGRCVSAIYKDDQGDPTQAAQVVRELIFQDQAQAIVGPFLGGPAGATGPLTTTNKIIQVMETAAPDPGDATKYPYAFRTEVVSTLQGATFVSAFKAAKYNKVGILYEDTPTGQGELTAIKAGAGSVGASVIDAESAPYGALDLSTQVRKIQAAGPDVMVLVVSSVGACAAAIKARNALNWSIPVLTNSICGFPQINQSVGTAGLGVTKVYAGQNYKNLMRQPNSDALASTKGQAFLKAILAFTGTQTLTTPVVNPASAYDSFQLVAFVYNKVGKVDVAAAKTYLEAHPYVGVKGTYKYDSQRHDGVTLEDLGWGEAGSNNGSSLVLANTFG